VVPKWQNLPKDFTAAKKELYTQKGGTLQERPEGERKKKKKDQKAVHRKGQPGEKKSNGV